MAHPDFALPALRLITNATENESYLGKTCFVRDLFVFGGGGFFVVSERGTRGNYRCAGFPGGGVDRIHHADNCGFHARSQYALFIVDHPDHRNFSAYDAYGRVRQRIDHGAGQYHYLRYDCHAT